MVRLWFVLTMFSTLPLSGMQSKSADATGELSDIQQQLSRAWVRGDRSAIERILSPDWSVIGPDGRTSTRADVLRDAFETKVHRVLALDIDDVRVRTFGDAAVVTGRTHGRGEYSNVAYDVTIRFTDVFSRTSGRWQAVASHASLLPPEKTRVAGQTSVIIDVTVIDPRSGRISEHSSAVVSGATITAIQPASVSPPPGARRIDGKGKFLIPGLWDAHVHLTKAGPRLDHSRPGKRPIW